MTVPFDLNAEVSSLCSTGLRPQTLTGAFLRLMAQKFSVPENIRDPRIRHYVWSPDDTLSKILIIPAYKWQAGTLQNRPAVVVKRNQWTISPLGIGDGLMVPAWHSDQIPANPEEMYIGVTGSHTMFIVARTAAEVEMLSTEVAMNLIHFGQAIRNDLMMDKLQVTEVGPVAIVEEDKENFAVPVTVAYTYVEAWTIVAETPLFKGMLLTTDVS